MHQSAVGGVSPRMLYVFVMYSERVPEDALCCLCLCVLVVSCICLFVVVGTLYAGIVTGWCGCGDHDESGTVPLLKCMLTGPAR